MKRKRVGGGAGRWSERQKKSKAKKKELGKTIPSPRIKSP